MNHNSLLFNKMGLNQEKLSIPVFAVCIVFSLVIGFLPVLSPTLTKVFRPFVILICFLMPGRYTYKMNKMVSVFLIYLLYMTMVFLGHNITGARFNSWMSAMLFGAFFVVLSQRIWSKKEIRLIIYTVAISTIIYTVLIHYYNHDLIHQADDLVYRGDHVNSNSASYTICTGSLCCLYVLLYQKLNRNYSFVERLFFLFGVTIGGYTLVCLGQRGGFFSFSIGALIILWEKFAKSQNKNQYRAILVLILVVGLAIAPRLTEGTHAERLFDYENLFYDNGRDELNARARELIKEKPFFGGGYENWEENSGESLGLHNGFLYVETIGGYTAGVLLGLFLISMLIEVVGKRNMVLLALAIVAAVHLFEDSGMDYFTYIPLILIYILLRYESFAKVPITKLFVDG